MSHADVREQTTWGGYNHIGSHLQTLCFYIEAVAVVTTIDGHAADAIEIVAKALHGLVYLLGQFTGGRHDDAVDGILGKTSVVEHAEDRQQISRCLACSGLCYTDKVLTVKYFWNTLFLNGCHLLEVHIP